MKPIFIFLFVFLFLDASYSQKLTFSQKAKCRKALRAMVKTDQHYRVLMAKDPVYNNDSIWRLQSVSDSLNKYNFIQLTEKYGFPSGDRIGNQSAVLLLLHFTMEKDFQELLPLFQRELKKQNMTPFEFAVWYDRCQVNMNLPNKYGAYGKKDFCRPELDAVNADRVSIGLEKLVERGGCK